MYANAAFHRVVSYTGGRPFTGGPVGEVPKATGKHPWAFWHGTENWSALLDANDQGLGLVTPGRVFFTGGFSGKPGLSDTFANATGYLAGQGEEILDHNITYDFRYELVVGSLKDIRARAVAVRPATLPTWGFSSDRQGWHYQDAQDQGWPVAGHLHIRLEQDDPQLISPYTFWQAEDAPFLIIEAALHTSYREATLFWQRHDQPGPEKENTLNFLINADDTFHRYVIRLAGYPGYRGALIRLCFDPAPAGRPGDWVKGKITAKKPSPSLPLARQTTCFSSKALPYFCWWMRCTIGSHSLCVKLSLLSSAPAGWSSTRSVSTPSCPLKRAVGPARATSSDSDQYWKKGVGVLVVNMKSPPQKAR